MPVTTPDASRLTSEEKKSLTHGEFWIPEAEREVYRLALHTLNQAGVPYVVSGLYAIHVYTGVYRQTKDLDLLMHPGTLLRAARALRAAGFELRLEQPHWLAKAQMGRVWIDLIFGMANGLGFIDHLWYQHSRPAILAANPVRVSPPEELIWHRLFIGERHRFDMADVVHLILHRGHELDWDRLLARVGEHWRLLLSQIHFFDYVYPDHRDRVPIAVRRGLQERAVHALREAEAAELRSAHEPKFGAPSHRCRGTLLSLFSFAIDVNEWGFEDERVQHVAGLRSLPIVEEIVNAEVWDER